MSSIGKLLNIVQIGDVPIHMHVLPRRQLAFEAPGDAQRALIGRTYVQDTQFAPAERTVEVEFRLFNAFGRTAYEIANTLMQIVGRVTDLIAIRVIDCHPDVMFGCYPCCIPQDIHALWLHAFGRIKELHLDSAYDVVYEGRMTLDLISNWQGLNPMHWSAHSMDYAYPYTAEYAAPAATVAGYKSEMAPPPLLQDFYDYERPISLQKHHYASTSYAYDPNYFQALYDYYDVNVPRCFHGRALSGSAASVDYAIHVPKAVWSMPPAMRYVFTNMLSASADDTLSVTVIAEDGWRTRTSTTTIDRQDVEDRIADTTGSISSSDKLILDTEDVQSAKIVLGGIGYAGIELPASDLITVTGDVLPGRLYPGLNQVTIAGASHGYLAIFQGM